MDSFSFRQQYLFQRLKLLHTCVSRSLPLEAALEGLLHSPAPARERRFHARLLHGLRGGQSLAEAMRAADPATPGMVLGLIAAGERGPALPGSGQLPACLSYLLEYYQRLDELKRSLSHSFTYPLIVLAFIWLSQVDRFLGIGQPASSTT